MQKAQKKHIRLGSKKSRWFIVPGIVAVLVICALVFVYARHLFPFQSRSAGSGCVGILIPAYFGPGGGMESTIAAAGAVKILTADIQNGPGSSVRVSWASAITRAKAQGIRVMGYVDTAFGKRSETAVEADVDTWKRFYGVTDIMFDDTWQPNTGKVTYYMDLTNYVHAQTPGAIDKENAGAGEPEAYVQTADILGIFEGSYGRYLRWKPPGWIYRYPPAKFLEEVYSVPNSAAVSGLMTLFQRNHAGYIMLTDSNAPWGTFSSPTFWSTFVAAIRSDCVTAQVDERPVRAS